VSWQIFKSRQSYLRAGHLLAFETFEPISPGPWKSRAAVLPLTISYFITRLGEYDDCNGANDMDVKSHPLHTAAAASPPQRYTPVVEQACTPRQQQSGGSATAATATAAEAGDDGDYSEVSEGNETEASRCITLQHDVMSGLVSSSCTVACCLAAQVV